MTNSKTDLKNQYPSQNANFELTQLDDETILYSVAHEKAVYLNATAQLIWNLCAGQDSVSEIIELLQQEYPNEPSIEQQVFEAIEKMREDGVIDLNDSLSS